MQFSDLNQASMLSPSLENGDQSISDDIRLEDDISTCLEYRGEASTSYTITTISGANSSPKEQRYPNEAQTPSKSSQGASSLSR